MSRRKINKSSSVHQINLCMFHMFHFQTINITTAATGSGLARACDTLVAQVWKKNLCPLTFCPDPQVHQLLVFIAVFLEMINIVHVLLCRRLVARTCCGWGWSFSGASSSCCCSVCPAGVCSSTPSPSCYVWARTLRWPGIEQHPNMHAKLSGHRICIPYTDQMTFTSCG